MIKIEFNNKAWVWDIEHKLLTMPDSTVGELSKLADELSHIEFYLRMAVHAELKD